MKSQLSWDRFYMSLAEKCAELSYDARKVGCVIVRNGNILSFSYNGTAPLTDNTTRDVSNETLPEVMHAEQAAIAKAAREGVSVNMSTVYITLSPCITCAKLLLFSGIKRVVYRDEYKDLTGIQYLQDNGVQTSKLQ